MSAKPLTNSQLDACLDEAVACAKLAGALVSECVTRMKFDKSTLNDAAEEKGKITDLVTEYDKQCEDLILTRLQKSFPDFDVLGEESFTGQALTDKPTWVVDPIDGTMSFIHSLFDCCVCVGLSVNRKAVLGVIYAPLLDELYTAVEGRGAFCNGDRIKTSPTVKLTKALVCSHFPSYTRSEAFVENLLDIWRGLMKHPVQGMRAYGSCGLDLCSIARGRLDCYFEVGIWAWDVCAGSIIVREAGGVMLDITGGPFNLENRRLLACSTPELAEVCLPLHCVARRTQHVLLPQEIMQYLKHYKPEAAKL